MADPLTFKFDPITADFTYIRSLGDRKGIEKLTMRWDKAVIDRTKELRSYANNHYAGHAPATVAQFIKLWNEKGFPQIDRPQPARVERALFPM